MSSHGRRLATAHHEAGHAVAALSVGIPIARVTIVPGEGFFGTVTLAARPLTAWQTQRRAEQHALVCLVGPAAHARCAGRQKWPRGYEHDLDAAHTWLSSESGDERETKAWIALIAERARLFVAADWEWSQICALAAALLECETLSGRAARAVLNRK